MSFWMLFVWRNQRVILSWNTKGQHLEAALKTTEKDQQEYESMCFTSKMLLMHLLKLQCVELLNGLCIVEPKCIS